MIVGYLLISCAPSIGSLKNASGACLALVREPDIAGLVAGLGVPL